jgi:organic radical activating enzyme/1-acyl-sn-glycerol-3-phosphate acyltransferase
MSSLISRKFPKHFAQLINLINTREIFGVIPYFSGMKFINILCKNNRVKNNYFSDQIALIKEYFLLLNKEDECDNQLIEKYLSSTDFLSKWRFRTISKVSDRVFYKKVRIEGLDIFERELKSGKGIILAGSHFGQLEVLFSFLHRYKKDIYYLVKDPSFHEIYRKNAADFVLNITTNSKEETFALLSKVKVLLENGNVLFIPGDGEYGNSTVSIEFLGKMRIFRKGFAEFALLTNSSIIPVLTFNGPEDKSVVEFHETIEYSKQNLNNDEETIAIIKKYATILEKNWIVHPYNIIPHYLKMHTESPNIIKSENGLNDFILLQWIVTTRCNMNCEYCYAVGVVNKNKDNKFENTLKIAARIIELSRLYKRVRLDITGGEILTYKDLDKILEIIKPVKNIELGIFTNATYFAVIESWIERFAMINISLHVKYRTNEEIDSIIGYVNKYKHKTTIVLSQVDYDLKDEDHVKLARIEYETGISIFFQTYIKPYFILEENDQDIEFSSLFTRSKDKICTMNCFAFTILPDGRLFYDLACRKNTRKTGHFSEPFENLYTSLTENQPKECPYQFCYNNYNIFYFEEYQNICDRFNIDIDSRFTQEYLSEFGTLKRDLVNTKHTLYLEKLKNGNLFLEKENIISQIPNSSNPGFEKNNPEIERLKQTYSWKIGYRITRIAKFLFFWVPGINKM